MPPASEESRSKDGGYAPRLGHQKKSHPGFAKPSQFLGNQATGKGGLSQGTSKRARVRQRESCQRQSTGIKGKRATSGDDVNTPGK